MPGLNTDLTVNSVRAAIRRFAAKFSDQVPDQEEWARAVAEFFAENFYPIGGSCEPYTDADVHSVYYLSVNLIVGWCAPGEVLQPGQTWQNWEALHPNWPLLLKQNAPNPIRAAVAQWTEEQIAMTLTPLSGQLTPNSLMSHTALTLLFKVTSREFLEMLDVDFASDATRQLIGQTVDDGVLPLMPRGLLKLMAAAEVTALNHIRGLTSPNSNPATHRCRYNNGKWISAEMLVGKMPTLLQIHTLLKRVELDPAESEVLLMYVPAYHKALICEVAYHFRATGHHFLDKQAAKYVQFRAKMPYAEKISEDVLPYKLLALHCTHLIFPDDLDLLWRNWAQHNDCPGQLQKRVNCPAAGQAGVVNSYKVGRQVRDCFFPGAHAEFNQMAAQFAMLENLYQHMDPNDPIGRWAGAQNRNFYGAPNLVVVEENFAGLITVGMAIMEYLALKTMRPVQMLNSRALQRIVDNVPIQRAVASKASAVAMREAHMLPLFRGLTIELRPAQSMVPEEEEPQAVVEEVEQDAE
jgi:hypothetical protein